MGAIEVSLSNMTVGSDSGCSRKVLCDGKGNGVIEFLKLASVISKAQEPVHIGVRGAIGQTKGTRKQGACGFDLFFSRAIFHDDEGAFYEMPQKTREDGLFFSIDPEAAIEANFIAQELHS